MFNSKVPNESDLPSTKQLLRSTAIALGVSLLLLVTVIMPSEYGLDPTGVGQVLGLTKMGEIKESLAAEKALEEKTANGKEATAAAAPKPASDPKVEQPAQAKQTTAAAAQPVNKPKVEKPAGQSHEMSITLKNNEAAEVKLSMNKGAKVDYLWTVNGGVVNYDTHGDSKETDYHGYGKGLGKPSDKGILVAAFDGKHGWFWRNRSGATVTVELKTQGHYLDIVRLF